MVDFRPEQKTVQTLIRILTPIYAVLLLPALGFALTALHLFNEPGTVTNRGYWLMAISAVTLPIIMLVSLFAARELYLEREYKWAVLVAILPFFNVGLYFLGLVLNGL